MERVLQRYELRLKISSELNELVCVMSEAVGMRKKRGIEFICRGKKRFFSFLFLHFHFW